MFVQFVIVVGKSNPTHANGAPLLMSNQWVDPWNAATIFDLRRKNSMKKDVLALHLTQVAPTCWGFSADRLDGATIAA